MSEKAKKNADFENLAILPVRDTVLFPNAILPLTVGRESSLELINSLPEGEKFISEFIWETAREMAVTEREDKEKETKN